MTVSIMAIDPGGTIGVAWRRADRIHLAQLGSKEDLWTLIKEVKPANVAYERFATAGRLSKYGLLTIEICGGVEALCWALDIPCFRQTPGQRYGLMKEAQQHRARVHETDALAHLLTWEHLHADRA